MTVAISVIITSYNRLSELEKTIASFAEQSFRSFEVIVVDDGSKDGTREIIPQKYPGVRFFCNATNLGSIASRNLLMREASGQIIISLDDDSRFVDANAFAQIVETFENDPQLGVVGFQIIGPEHPSTLNPANRKSGTVEVGSYVSCGAAIRRSILPKVGEYVEFFFHSYEEPDFAMRVWDRGFRVVRNDDIVVYHEFSSLNRNELRTHFRHARNELCSVVMRYPLWLIPYGLAGKALSQFRYSTKRGWSWVIAEPRIWWHFLRLLPISLQKRAPIQFSTLARIWKLNSSN